MVIMIFICFACYIYTSRLQIFLIYLDCKWYGLLSNDSKNTTYFLFFQLIKWLRSVEIFLLITQACKKKSLKCGFFSLCMVLCLISDLPLIIMHGRVIYEKILIVYRQIIIYIPICFPVTYNVLIYIVPLFW